MGADRCRLLVAVVVVLLVGAMLPVGHVATRSARYDQTPDTIWGAIGDVERYPSERGTRLSITENGEVYNPAFRFLSRFVFGHASTMEKYLSALGRRFGETVRPEEG